MLRRLAGKAAFFLALVVSVTSGADEPTFWDELVRPQGSSRDVLVARAVALLEAGSAPAAARLLEEAVGLDGREPLGLYLLGVARFRAQAWAGCAETLVTLQHAAPDFQPTVPGSDGIGERVNDMLGLCLALGGRLDEAVAHYRRLLADGEGDISPEVIHGNLGDCYHALGRLEEAIAEYQAAIAISPRRAAFHAALAVAYDRDERALRGREAMADALQIDPQLAELSASGTFFIPPSDAHYYLGLGHLVAGDVAPHRALAIVYFRKYLDTAPSRSPWTPRARQHLAELGSAALRAADITVLPSDAPEGPQIARSLVAAGPELANCFAVGSRAVVRATVAFHGGGTEPAPAPTVSLTSVGPDAVSMQVFECMDKILTSQRHAVHQMTRFQIAIMPP